MHAASSFIKIFIKESGLFPTPFIHLQQYLNIEMGI